MTARRNQKLGMLRDIINRLVIPTAKALEPPQSLTAGTARRFPLIGCESGRWRVAGVKPPDMQPLELSRNLAGNRGWSFFRFFGHGAAQDACARARAPTLRFGKKKAARMGPFSKDAAPPRYSRTCNLGRPLSARCRSGRFKPEWVPRRGDLLEKRRPRKKKKKLGLIRQPASGSAPVRPRLARMGSRSGLQAPLQQRNGRGVALTISSVFLLHLCQSVSPPCSTPRPRLARNLARTSSNTLVPARLCGDSTSVKSYLMHALFAAGGILRPAQPGLRNLDTA